MVNKHTEQVKKNIWIYHGMYSMNSMLQVKTLSHWKARIWLPVAFQKIPDTHIRC